VLAMAGCGGGGGGGSGGSAVPTVPSASAIKDALTAASSQPANDTATNSSASFTVLQTAGLAAVTVNSPPKVNFAVFSNGRIKTDIAITNVRFAIAKLIPGTNGGDPDQWVSYVYGTETATAGVGPGGVPVLATAKQATTDGKLTGPELAALPLPSQLVYNSDGGYYTYTFKTDIKDPSKTNGVVFEPARTHRVAIQLSYLNDAGETVLVNPYFDFTLDANGKSVAVTDPTKTRKMTDVTSCNGFHEKLALHGGGRVDTQYCVMCHNPGTTDANSGNNLNLSTMVHKLHAGRLLKSKLATGGEDYTIWGYQNTRHNYAEVGFPQDLRNCATCHSAANPKTPQGDNWKTKASKEACLTCHANNAGSGWNTTHTVIAGTLVGPGAAAKSLSNQLCAGCHGAGSDVSPERVHWNQNEENAAKYKMNIESAVFNDTADHRGRTVTVKYYLSDPTNNNAAYDLVTRPECTGTAPITCGSTTKFGNLRFYLAYQNMPGQSSAVTEYSAYNNGGSGANAYAYKGINDPLNPNHYTVDIPVPNDVAGVSVAFGSARVVGIGQIKEAKLEVKSATDPRPEVVPRVLVNTVVQHTFKDVAPPGSAVLARRAIVSNEKCNVCHGALGTTSGSNTLASAFHDGARNTVEACVLCHDANRVSTSTVMTNGLTLNESYQFKRMIHGIHGNSKRVYPFTHGNPVLGVFDKAGVLSGGGTFLAGYFIRNFAPLVLPAGTPVAAGATFETIATMINNAATGLGYTGAPQKIENYAAEVAYPQVGLNCNACHVNNSYLQDSGPLGSVVFKDTGVTSPNLWKVISPKAATCTACHDSSKSIGHVTSFGGAAFGDRTQAAIAVLPRETCDDCHASGSFKGVDIVHGQK